MNRRNLVAIHRYVALLFGVPVVLLCLAGALLVFREDLAEWFTPAIGVGAGPYAAGDYQRILSAARMRVPDATKVNIILPARAGRATLVVVESQAERHLYIHPQTGAVVADSLTQWLPFETFFRLHTRFLAGPDAEYLAAAAGLSLLLLAAIGLVLWWPRAWAQAFRVRWDGNRQVVCYGLHRAIGAAFAAFLLMNAVTGLVLVFATPVAGLVNGATGNADAPVRPSDVPVKHASIPGTALGLDALVAAAERGLPAGSVTRVLVPDGELPVMVRKLVPGENPTHGMNRIFVDRFSGEVLHASPLGRQPPGNRLFEWLYPWHTGNLFGWAYKALLLLAGIAPALSLVTGLIVWQARSRKR